MIAASSPCPANRPGKDEISNADALGLQLVRLARLIGHAKARFARRFSQEDGIESAAYMLLVHLVGGGPQRTTALAENVHSDTSTVSRQIGALVRHGLVERRADPQDGRACLLAATAEGERVFHFHRQQRNKEIAGLVSHWPSGDVERLVELLDRMNTELESYEPKASDGDEQPVRTEGEGR
jgi:DNA-binding MarR family transcriptional regulator